MSGVGIRNWRGEIIQPKAAESGGAVGDEGHGILTVSTASSQIDITGINLSTSVGGSSTAELSSHPSKDRQLAQTKVLQKDEFGRDVEVVIVEKRRKKSKEERNESRKKERKHKHKEHKHRRDRSCDESMSPSLLGRLVGTPPPPDPFRPQLDENRDRRPQRRTQHRSRSRSGSRRSRSRSRRHSRSRTRGNTSPRTDSHRLRHHHRSSSRIRSRSRGRDRSRSQRSSRSHRRHSSASVERRWTHNAFDDRSPSPPRDIDPFYRPEPESWVSRAGGVYLSRK